jgi:ligand-binding sensor domain-containing protein
MRSILTIFLLYLLSSFTVSSENKFVGWKTYLSHYNTNKVEESADKVFVVAEGTLYTYGKEDNSIKEFYKGNGLNDTDIQFISYNKQTKSLLIVYKNCNIDLLEGNNIKNIPYLYTTTSIKNKEVNGVTIHNEYAYLSTEFGIVVVNMSKKEITDTYNLSQSITSCAILNNQIYASTATNVIYGLLSDNLLDKSNWKVYHTSSDTHIDEIVSFNNQLFFLSKKKGVYYTSNGHTTTLLTHSQLMDIKVTGDKLACITNSQVYIYSDIQTFDRINLTIKDISTYQTDKYWIAEGSKGLRSIKKAGSNQFEATNEAILLDGPYINSPYKITFKNDKVYLIPGGKVLTKGTKFNLPGVIMIYDCKEDKWSLIDRTVISNKFKVSPVDYTSILVDTNETGDEIIYVSAMGDGLIQLVNQEATHLYTNTNSPLENAAGLSGKYCRVDGLALDKDGNLWMTNSEVENGIKILDKENKWHSLYVESLKGKYTINDILITSNNDKWVNIPRPTNQTSITVIADNPSLNKAVSYQFTNFIDTDGNNFSPSNFTCMAEDKNGYVWVGTNKGAIYFTNPKLASSENYSSMRCTRVKLINEEDDTPYYFLDNVIVTTIKIDNGNRKWIGTEGNGVYVLSNDNQEVVHQFNTSNSPLLSDNIYAIEINPQTGEVFIGTDKGLVSYKGEATEGKNDYSDVYAYPNPVRPEHGNKVTITGLMDNSIVKITDLNGNLIYQTKSLGGQAIWNCQNSKGTRVASGIYLVLSATEDSKESIVTKIAVIK